MIKHLKKDNFDQELEGKTILVDFFATWCGPCKMLGPVLEDLDKEDIIEIAKVNVDEEMDLAARYQISTIPTIIVFKNGELLKKSIGFQSLSDLKEFIKE